MATTFIAKVDGNVVGKRTSKDRTYTHCIVGRKSVGRYYAEAAAFWKSDADNWDYYRKQVESGPGGTTYHHGDGRAFTLTTSEKDYERAKVILAEHPAPEGFQKARAAKRTEELSKRFPGGNADLEVYTWCGRLDLAHKQLSSFGKSGYYSDLRIVEVEKIEKPVR